MDQKIGDFDSNYSCLDRKDIITMVFQENRHYLHEIGEKRHYLAGNWRKTPLFGRKLAKIPLFGRKLAKNAIIW
jgi:hypothetical protein